MTGRGKKGRNEMGMELNKKTTPKTDFDLVASARTEIERTTRDYEGSYEGGTQERK